MLSLNCWSFKTQLLSGDHLQNQVPVAKQFSTLSVRLWLVDWRGLTVSAFYYLYSGALVFFFTQSCQIRVTVAFGTIKQIFDTSTKYARVYKIIVLLNVRFSCRGSHYLTFKWLYHSN